MVHYSPLSAPVDSILGLAISLALRFNLHQDPAQIPQHQTSYPTIADGTSQEMRRRLWWHLMTVDVQYAEVMKTDPIITEAMWTTKFPRSFNDSELDASSELPIPPRTGEIFDPETYTIQNANSCCDGHENSRTDISFALSRIEIMHALRRHGFSEQFCLNNGYEYISKSTARVQYINDLVNKVNQKYLQFWKGNDSLGFFERNAMKIILSKYLMLAKQDEPARDQLRDYVQVIEAAVGLRKTYPKCAWLVRQPVELDALELLWEYFTMQPGSGQLGSDADKQHAWKLAEKATESGDRDNLASCYPTQWSRIQKLCNRAVELRSGQTPSGVLEQEN